MQMVVVRFSKNMQILSKARAYNRHWTENDRSFHDPRNDEDDTDMTRSAFQYCDVTLIKQSNAPCNPDRIGDFS